MSANVLMMNMSWQMVMNDNIFSIIHSSHATDSGHFQFQKQFLSLKKHLHLPFFLYHNRPRKPALFQKSVTGSASSNGYARTAAP